MEGPYFGAGRNGRHGIRVLGQGHFTAVGRGVESPSARDRKGRHMMGIVGREVAELAARNIDEKEMRALVSCEVIPVSVQEVCEHLCLDLAVGERLVAGGIAAG